jgi:vanillate/3-O-methylgallate O-demethylase
MNAAQRRKAYEQLVLLKERPFVRERPAIFSPAAAAQDLANAKGLYFRWTPLILPYEYTNWVEESLAHVQTCYIGDWSALHKVRVAGPEALAFLSHIGMNDLSRFEIGQIKHHVQLDEAGRVASEGVLYRTAREEFIYTGGGGDWALYQFSRSPRDAVAEEISPDLFIFEIQGPKSLLVLEKAAAQSLRDIRFNHSRTVEINGITVRVLRTGISGELGYELHGAVDDADAIWSAVVEGGADFGLRQIGVRSQLVAHIETGIATPGLDYLPASIVTPGAPKLFPSGVAEGSFIPVNGIADYFRTPHELGWGSRGTLCSHEFIGRDALVAQQKQDTPARCLVGLLWNSADVIDLLAAQFAPGPRSAPMDMPRAIGGSFDQVLDGGRMVGISSSRTHSSHLLRTISLCVIERSHAAPGTMVSVLWGSPGTAQRAIRAEVAALPLKPDRRRTNVNAM